jgi:hypothetical protein
MAISSSDYRDAQQIPLAENLRRSNEATISIADLEANRTVSAQTKRRREK